MSQDDLERLVREHRLAWQEFDDAEVRGFWSKAITAFGETRVRGISTDTSLQIAYRACLQATLAVLAAIGLRPKSTAGHYIAFYSLQQLDDEALRRIAIQFDELRSTRAESVYEPNDDEVELQRQLGHATQALENGLPLMRAWLIKTRPSLGILLPTEPKRT